MEQSMSVRGWVDFWKNAINALNDFCTIIFVAFNLKKWLGVREMWRKNSSWTLINIPTCKTLTFLFKQKKKLQFFPCFIKYLCPLRALRKVICSRGQKEVGKVLSALLAHLRKSKVFYPLLYLLSVRLARPVQCKLDTVTFFWEGQMYSVGWSPQYECIFIYKTKIYLQSVNEVNELTNWITTHW